MQDRQFIQQQFLTGHLQWIVATNAFGMGVHKNDVRQVIHETMPSTISNYMQEIGRAGRDGESSVAILLYSEGDEQLTQFVTDFTWYLRNLLVVKTSDNAEDAIDVSTEQYTGCC